MPSIFFSIKGKFLYLLKHITILIIPLTCPLHFYHERYCFSLVFELFAPTLLSFILLHDFAESKVVQEHIYYGRVENTGARCKNNCAYYNLSKLLKQAKDIWFSEKWR